MILMWYFDKSVIIVFVLLKLLQCVILTVVWKLNRFGNLESIKFLVEYSFSYLKMKCEFKLITTNKNKIKS